MTPSKQAKAAGHKSLKAVADKLGFKPDGSHIVAVATLRNWHKNKPALFAVVLAGAAEDMDIGKLSLEQIIERYKSL